MNTSAWRLWTSCVCQGPGLLPVHDFTHAGRFTPSSISASSTPTGSWINFHPTAGYYKKAAWEARHLWKGADLYSVVMWRQLPRCVLTVLCPCAVLCDRNEEERAFKNQSKSTHASKQLDQVLPCWTTASGLEIQYAAWNNKQFSIIAVWPNATKL